LLLSLFQHSLVQHACGDVDMFFIFNQSDSKQLNRRLPAVLTGVDTVGCRKS
jgi:hypothetical protein